MNTDRLQESSERYEGGDDGDEDVDNIDFNNYKGIYADEDAGQKYTCPVTGAHFEPRDLCKRIYKVIDKRMPLQYELYGQNMLVDGVGTSLLAEAPYAQSKKRSASNTSAGMSKPQARQHQAPNARAGSMK